MKKIFRIINKFTKEFIRDDFQWNSLFEIALDVESSQGLSKPKWDEASQSWVEGQESGE